MLVSGVLAITSHGLITGGLYLLAPSPILPLPPTLHLVLSNFCNMTDGLVASRLFPLFSFFSLFFIPTLLCEHHHACLPSQVHWDVEGSPLRLRPPSSASQPCAPFPHLALQANWTLKASQAGLPPATSAFSFPPFCKPGNITAQGNSRDSSESISSPTALRKLLNTTTWASLKPHLVTPVLAPTSLDPPSSLLDCNLL